MRNWNDAFSSWAAAPSKTEQDRCENAIKAIKDAINGSDALSERGVKVFLQGSYRNRVNVKQNSDVDVGVCCTNTFFYKLPKGAVKEDFNIVPSTYSFEQFKREVREALDARFSPLAVSEGNKAFDIKSNTYRVEADLAPFFEYRSYAEDGSYLSGVELKTAVGEQVINWPQQHYDNGVQKNTETSRRYKSLVRVLKKLCCEMQEKNIHNSLNIPGFLCECLIWNVPNEEMGKETLVDDLDSALKYLFFGMQDGKDVYWREVSGLKTLFQDSQKWSKEDTANFIASAWSYVYSSD